MYTIVENEKGVWVVDGKGFRCGPFDSVESAYYYACGRERTDE